MIRRAGFIFLGLLTASAILIQCNVIWRSPKSYQPKRLNDRKLSIMSLDAYTNSGLINTHPRPYVYQLQATSGGGAVFVFGADHSRDPQNSQMHQIEIGWKHFQPTVALVEGRLGFLFLWVQDPIRKYGEGGLTAMLAKKNHVPLYSWEPDRDAEIKYLIKRYDAKQVAAYYCLRPYRNNYSGLTIDEANRAMLELIKERTKYIDIEGKIRSVQQIDSLWKADYPQLMDWRFYRHPTNGWPQGTLSDINEASNQFRDVHMCLSIIDLVAQGERVFIMMGSSHAPRIERTLKEVISLKE